MPIILWRPSFSFEGEQTGSVRVSNLSYEWRVHLAARDPRRASFAGLASLAAVLCVGISTRNLAFTGFLGVGLFGSLADFWLPVRYRLTDRGAEARHLWTFAAMEWKQVRRRTMSNEGIRLSPFPRPSRLDPFRGMVLRFGDQSPEAILQRVRALHRP